MTAAAELMKQQKFADAALAYEKIVAADRKNARAWYQLGAARYSLKDYAGSIKAYETNFPLSDNAFSLYNIACDYALLGDREKAMDYLQKAIDHPKMIPAAINFDDPDLANLKAEAKFIAARDKVDRKVRPCMYSTEARQFDFFVGEWDAFNPQGQKAGSSVIQTFANGCGVLENWSNAFGSGNGKSINYYDASDAKWHQHWIGPNGSPANYAGTFSDGALRFIGEPSTTRGVTTLSRLTFFNLGPNTVRQLAEASTDGGKTWTTTYDFKYVRRK